MIKAPLVVLFFFWLLNDLDNKKTVTNTEVLMGKRALELGGKYMSELRDDSTD
jgi:hypothetical protein